MNNLLLRIIKQLIKVQVFCSKLLNRTFRKQQQCFAVLHDEQDFVANKKYQNKLKSFEKKVIICLSMICIV